MYTSGAVPVAGLTSYQMKGLPREVHQLIRNFASDQLPPSQSARLIKQLRFQYRGECVLPVYRPLGLEITAGDAYFTTRVDGRHHKVHGRHYAPQNFLPSYWSLYANSFDDRYQHVNPNDMFAHVLQDS